MPKASTRVRPQPKTLQEVIALGQARRGRRPTVPVRRVFGAALRRRHPSLREKNEKK